MTSHLIRLVPGWGQRRTQPLLLGVDPGQRDLYGRHALGVGYFADGVRDGLVGLGGAAGEPGVTAAESLASSVFRSTVPVRKPSAERRVRHEADAELGPDPGHGNHELVNHSAARSPPATS